MKKLLLAFALLTICQIHFVYSQTPGGGVVDIQGNSYPTVIIGNQEWMAANLKVSKWKNGDVIPYISGNSNWANATTSGLCILNNDSATNFQNYGYLYNFYVIEDPRGLCPTGWRVPSDSEWVVMGTYLGGLSVAGGKLKSTSSLWQSPNTGATNLSGFSALPNGLRDFPGNFSSWTALATFWSSTQRQMSGYYDGWYRDIWYNSAQLERLSYSKKNGFAVRCMRNFVCSDSIIVQPANQSGFIGGNKNVNFAHSGVGINYQWQSNSVNLGWQNVPNGSQYSGANTNNLTINNLSVSNHNQLFRVVSGKIGCNSDTTNIVKITISNIGSDSSRLVRLIGDSTRLTLDSIAKQFRIIQLTQDSALGYARVVKLSNDSIYYVGRLAKLMNDSAILTVRVIKLSNDSVLFIGRINKLITDSILHVGRINSLIADSINSRGIIASLNVQIGIKNNIISILQNDTARKNDTINNLRIALLNKHDTVYVSSIITSDTLRISITTGLLPATGIVNMISVYPNPASTILHLDLKNPGYYTATMTGVTGQTIITPTSGTIDISGLANGVYILTIYDKESKFVSTNKVMIIR